MSGAQSSVVQRVIGRPFPKGVSGNPGGKRPQKDVSELCRAYTREAVQRLGRMLQSDDERAAGFAAVALLDRGWGKPSQRIETDAPTSLTVLHYVAAEAISRELPVSASDVIDAQAEPEPAESTPEPAQLDLLSVPPPSE